jgi:FKBP-type peptidyl-prolyl cis-trans isomerase SlyD
MDKITKNKVVKIEYSIYDESGNLVETEKEFSYIHGYNQIFPKLEDELEGMSVGETKEITLKPEEAYGNYDISAVQSVPLDVFQGHDIQEGQTYYAESEKGEIVPFTVRKINQTENQVIVDFNHPLAGKTLKFDIKVVSIRDADEDEKKHQHIH